MHFRKLYSFWCLKWVYEPSKAPQRSVKIKLIFSYCPGSGREGLVLVCARNNRALLDILVYPLISFNILQYPALGNTCIRDNPCQIFPNSNVLHVFCIYNKDDFFIFSVDAMNSVRFNSFNAFKYWGSIYMI